MIDSAIILTENRLRRLKSKKAQPTAAQTASPPKSVWVLLRKTKEKAARMGDQFSESLFLVDFSDEIQTYFRENI